MTPLRLLFKNPIQNSKKLPNSDVECGFVWWGILKREGKSRKKGGAKAQGPWPKEHWPLGGVFDSTPTGAAQERSSKKKRSRKRGAQKGIGVLRPPVQD